MQIFPLSNNSSPTASRIEPHVHSVSPLRPLPSLCLVAFRKEFLYAHGPPRIRPMLRESFLYVRNRLIVNERILAAVVVEDWYRHAPASLPRYTPVRTAGYEAGNPVLSDCRHPLHRLDRLHGLVFEAVHRAEPLARRPEDGGFLRPPVVRVLMLVLLFHQQCPNLIKGGNSLEVTVAEHVFSHESLPRLLREPSSVVNWAQKLQPILHARKVILLSVTWGSVHKSGTAFRGDVVTARQDGGHTVV
mmetsp:Transcript_23405/g.48710  ORF Transcript_23405/g.48710 Transcript_23405/m.48710 type:complete len:246 (+) Transcript_23405:1267-2004(+)